jgi:outer membrane protein assembly factor BamB
MVFFPMLTSVFLVPLSLSNKEEVPQDSIYDTIKSDKNIRIINPTFLGNEQRNYYGNKAPSDLSLNWKLYLGQGQTVISRKLGSRIWAGAGWTGQPLLVEEDTTLYIIQGAFDHNLKKINASSGQILWQYKFDDVIKGTGTIWKNNKPGADENQLVILQGSRLGVGNYLDSDHIPSFRAVSFFTGKELWRLDVKWTDSYSRDVDGSALVINDTVYIGLENSLFTILNPDPTFADSLNGMFQPQIIGEIPLYEKKDAIAHKNNVVTESSPCLLGEVIYIASGSGHVYGYDRKKQQLTWDFFIGSDIDGSAVITDDSCLIVTIEKQYIKGNGGAFKLNPSKPPLESVVWFLPTENSNYATWKGGIIGSAGVNDAYHNGELPYLAVFSAIDGYLYVVEHTRIKDKTKVKGPDGITLYQTPVVCYREKTGPSISTPLITDNSIITAGYNGIHLYSYDKNLAINKLDTFGGTFEATPVIHDNRLYIASRDGYLYCLGK